MGAHAMPGMNAGITSAPTIDRQAQRHEVAYRIDRERLRPAPRRLLRLQHRDMPPRIIGWD